MGVSEFQRVLATLRLVALDTMVFSIICPAIPVMSN